MKVLKKVLVLEDSDVMHGMYRTVLARYRGCEIIQARDGEEGLSQIAAHPDADLIILDINMPKIDGLKVLSHLRQEMKSDMAVIIVSTAGRDEDVERGLSLGADAYMTKPFQSSQFHEIVANLHERTDPEDPVAG